MFSGTFFGQEIPKQDTLFIFKPDCHGSFTNNLFQKTLQLRDCIKRPIDYETLKSFDFEKQLCKDPDKLIQFNNCFMSPKMVLIKNKWLGFKDSNKMQELNFINLPSSSYYIDKLGIFCKKELQLDQLTPMPIRFRLGSLEYVNWMEQKPNAIKPQ
jgi:hypothetical protein